jgi:hypothetical protein
MFFYNLSILFKKSFRNSFIKISSSPFQGMRFLREITLFYISFVHMLSNLHGPVIEISSF